MRKIDMKIYLFKTLVLHGQVRLVLTSQFAKKTTKLIEKKV